MNYDIKERPLAFQLRKLKDRLETIFESQVGSKLRDVRNYILPELGQFDGEDRTLNDPAEEKARRIVIATAEQACDILASGFQGGMTPPAQKWFLWRPTDKNLLEASGVRQWFDEVERIMYATLAGSNFYDTTQGAYTEIGGFGNFCMLMEDDEQDIVRFTQIPCGSFFWSLDGRGEVDTVVRVIKFTARQLALTYGEENLSEATRKLLSTDPESQVECYHIVTPRKDYNVQSHMSKDMPYASYTIEAVGDSEDDAKLLNEGGYREFPYLCARWWRYGQDVYSKRCPGISSLPDVRQLQTTAKMILKMGAKAADPPMRVPSGFKGRLKLMPGSQNAVSTQSPDAVSPLYQINLSGAQFLREWIETVLKPEIDRFFFVDVFRMFTDDTRSNTTATEILERRQEKMTAMGPITTRYQRVLDHMLTRMFHILNRRGEIPPPPPALSNAVIDIEYTSVLAQAQKSAQRGAIMSMLELAGNIGGIKQDVMDKIDFDQAIDEMHSITGAPASILRSDEQVQIIRNARMQAAQQASEAQGAQIMADVGSKAADVSTDPSTMSGKLMQQVGLG